MGTGILTLGLGMLIALAAWGLPDRGFGHLGVLHDLPRWVHRLFRRGRREVRVSEILALLWGVLLVVVGSALTVGVVPAGPFADWLAGATITLGAVVYGIAILAMAVWDRFGRHGQS